MYELLYASNWKVIPGLTSNHACIVTCQLVASNSTTHAFWYMCHNLDFVIIIITHIMLLKTNHWLGHVLLESPIFASWRPTNIAILCSTDTWIHSLPHPSVHLVCPILYTWPRIGENYVHKTCSWYYLQYNGCMHLHLIWVTSWLQYPPYPPLQTRYEGAGYSYHWSETARLFPCHCESAC